MEDFLKSLKAWLYDRASNPLFFIFVFSWCFWNYELFIVAFTGADPTLKLSLIEHHLYGSTERKLLLWLVYPTATTLFMVLIYPALSHATFYVLKRYEIWSEKTRLRLDSKTPVDEEKHRLLRAELIALESKFIKLEDEKHAEISELRKTITTLQANIPPEKNIYPDQDMTDLEREILGALRARLDSERPYQPRREFESAIKKEFGKTTTEVEVALRKLETRGLLVRQGNDKVGEQYVLSDDGKAIALRLAQMDLIGSREDTHHSDSSGNISSGNGVATDEEELFALQAIAVVGERGRGSIIERLIDGKKYSRLKAEYVIDDLIARKFSRELGNRIILTQAGKKALLDAGRG